MDFLLNELSVHGQFATAHEFASSVETVMEIRDAIRQSGRELLCSRDVAYRNVTPDSIMQQAVQAMPRERRLAWIQWLARLGPYWSDDQEHSPDEWLEADGGMDVAGTALGEASYCCLHGLPKELVSIHPSDWIRQVLRVTWMKDYEHPMSVDIRNHWELATVAESLDGLPSPFSSWVTLEEHARRTCGSLTFADNAFGAFRGQPYAHGAAERLLIRLHVLNRMCGCFDDEGKRTPEGDRLYAKHFVGKKAWFTDSGPNEKEDFEDELTFPHPDQPGEYLFCTWHGKVKTPQLRIHFTWPIVPKRPVYVVYVGPKITKR